MRAPWVLALDRYVDFGELRHNDTFMLDALTDRYAYQDYTVPLSPNTAAERWEVAVPVW